MKTIGEMKKEKLISSRLYRGMWNVFVYRFYTKPGVEHYIFKTVCYEEPYVVVYHDEKYRRTIPMITQIFEEFTVKDIYELFGRDAIANSNRVGQKTLEELDNILLTN